MLIQGRSVKEAPKQYPANPKLWNMVTLQAKTRFPKYPSPAAAHWVHAHYSQLGGKFVDHESEVDPRFRDRVKEAQDKKEEEQRKKVTKPLGRNVLKGEGRRI